LGDEEIEELADCFQSGWLGTGPKVAKFENDFRDYKGARNAVAVSSCTAALHLSALAAGVGPGDEVVTTPMTFCSTVNAIIHAGATPVLADVDPVTMNISPSEIERKISPKTKAILPVHFAGRPCEMDEIMQISRKHGIKVIEDCAHAVETEYKGIKAGLFGDFGCFSFYVTKNITTGEGGMVVTRDDNDSARIKILGLHGLSKDAWKRFGDTGYKHYEVVECGYKYNMMDIQAAIGIHQLKRVEAYWLRRREVWDKYNLAFADTPLTLPAEPARDTRHAYHLYTVLVDEKRAKITRDEFLERMAAENIGVGVHYMSVPEHPYYRKTFGWKPEDYPNAMQIGRKTVSLPISAALSDEDVNDVITSVRKTLRV
jgi:dTDP-4-amino-4,6-dideoxygalactose transaminase